MKKPAGKTLAGKKRPARRQVAKLADDEIRPEYDFSKGRPNPYAARFQAGVTVVALDADVAATFPDAAAVNEALRALVKIATRPARKSTPKRRTA
jgi:hypothetical protein